MLTEETLRMASLEVQQYLTESVPEEEAPHQFSGDFEKRMRRTILWNRMKKWIPAILFVTVALAIFIYAKATDNDPLWQVPLSEEARERLNNQLMLQYSDSVNWECPTALGGDPYYGTINGCIIIRSPQWSIWDTALGRIQVGDYIFYWDDPLRIYAYRDGEFCLLEEAYERGWLTDAHIEKIYDEHQERIALWTDERQEVFKKEFEKLEERLQGK